MDEYQRFFGANIRKLRKLHGLTQTDEKSLEHIYNSMVFALSKTSQ